MIYAAASPPETSSLPIDSALARDHTPLVLTIKGPMLFTQD
jgi:hypothetical protein